ncbi:MAG: response regulator with CheY-like receiver domain and winged-helix DNA-binding domain [Rhodocyclaceae bacterium]|nr:response regulator with CheY-like receiver domain and winged-helix DNA-binding domain [Rhodocyclaceae bacterium]
MKNLAKTILLVEDNSDDEELTRIAFEESRLANELVVVRDGEEALDYLFGTGRHAGRDLDNMPQLILLDLKLPKVNGHEVLERIRADARTRYIPVVVLTTSSEESDLLGSYDLGANSFIQKPVDFVSFIEAVRQVGAYWLVLNANAPH